MQLIVTETRSNRIENRHKADVCRSTESDPAGPWVYWRSCAKPFQAIPLIFHQPNLSLPLLAIACASHTGTPTHQAMVRALLGNLPVSALRCGTHHPVDETTRHTLILEGKTPNPLHHNCSGKHAGLLHACRQAGWPIDTYDQLTHPAQQMIAASLAALTGVDILEAGIDGCGLPTFYGPLAALAAAYASLAVDDGLRLQRLAMQQHPLLVGGDKRPDTRLIQLTQGRLLAKTGADGTFAVGNTATGEGLAIKVWSGRDDLRNVLVWHQLTHYEWLSKSEIALGTSDFSMIRRNGMGCSIGDIFVSNAQ